MNLCEHCDNQKIVGDRVVTVNCVHIMLSDMKTLYRNSRANYVSSSEKIKTKRIIESYGLDIHENKKG